MAPRLKARKMRDIDDARRSSKGGGGEGFIMFVPEDGILVRLMAEPDEWWSYTEHYDKELGSFPCVDGDCVGCEQGMDESHRYLVPAVDINEDRALALKIPKSLANEMVSKFDRRHTVMDRDYFFRKEGSGMKTKYKVDDEEKRRFNFDKYEQPDLGAVLVAAWNNVFGDGDTSSNHDDDDDDRPRRGSKRTSKKASRKVVSRGSKKAPTRKATKTTRRRVSRR